MTPNSQVTQEEPNPLGLARNNPRCSCKWVTFLSILFSGFSVSIIFLFVLYFILKPDFYSYIGFSNEFVLKKPELINDPEILESIGRLVKNGTLLSLDDFWSFQSNLYQTIITVLIALNAIIAAFSFFIIKNSSIENAREEARNEAVSEVRRYIESIVFNNEIKSILDEKIKSLQLDLASQIETVDELILTCNVGEINKLSIDYSELRRQLKVLAERVSELDKDETDGKELIIGHKV
ncbi:hypothetical protein [Pectobacterium polaris]|uniref:hypothetical protein n=1 Tax=Pectobacterium polaris TaxID=2042057 RepID=UPI001D03C688|nr:hypothetical protein [Pectobacterium polaris]